MCIRDRLLPLRPLFPPKAPPRVAISQETLVDINARGINKMRKAANQLGKYYTDKKFRQVSQGEHQHLIDLREVVLLRESCGKENIF